MTAVRNDLSLDVAEEAQAAAVAEAEAKKETAKEKAKKVLAAEFNGKAAVAYIGSFGLQRVVNEYAGEALRIAGTSTGIAYANTLVGTTLGAVNTNVLGLLMSDKPTWRAAIKDAVSKLGIDVLAGAVSSAVYVQINNAFDRTPEKEELATVQVAGPLVVRTAAKLLAAGLGDKLSACKSSLFARCNKKTGANASLLENEHGVSINQDQQVSHPEMETERSVMSNNM